MHYEDKIRNLGFGIFIVMLVMPFFWLQPYYDDVMRFYHGYIGLKVQGRILTEFYYRFAGGYSKHAPVNLNVFNLILISALLFFALSHFNKNIVFKNYLISVCSTIAILSSPFLLENLSYHVDNIGMMVSLILAIYASIAGSDSSRKSIATTIILIVLSVLFYQASLSVFCASVVVLALGKIIYGCDSVKFIIRKLLSFIASIIIIFLLNKLIVRDDYVYNKSKMISFSYEGFKIFIDNVVKITNLLIESFNSIQLLLLISLFLCSLVGIFMAVIRLKNFKKCNYFEVAVLFVSLPLLTMFVYFPAALFDDPVLEPRVFMSFGFIVSGMIVAASSIVILEKWVIGASLAFSVSVLMSSSAYVAAAQTMNAREEQILFRIESDIRYALHENGAINLSFQGRPEASPSEELSFKAFPIISRILRQAYGDSWHNPAFVGQNAQTIQYVELKSVSDYLPVLNRPNYIILKNEEGNYLVRFVPVIKSKV